MILLNNDFLDDTFFLEKMLKVCSKTDYKCLIKVIKLEFLALKSRYINKRQYYCCLVGYISVEHFYNKNSKLQDLNTYD